MARSLSDTDADTKIEVESAPDEDKIHFTLGSKEHFRMNKGTLEFINTAGSVYLGEKAGLSHNYGWSKG